MLIYLIDYILGTDGTVYDYFSGIQHIKERRIVFVGDATTRIKEDYLRILRYFRCVFIKTTWASTLLLASCRFYGRIAKETNCYDQETLDAIKANVSGLSRISGERIWSELKKILEGNYAGDLMQTMLKVGVAEFIGNFLIALYCFHFKALISLQKACRKNWTLKGSHRRGVILKARSTMP